MHNRLAPHYKPLHKLHVGNGPAATGMPCRFIWWKSTHLSGIVDIPRLSPGFKRKDMRLEMTCFCFPYSVVFLRKRAIQARKSYVAGLLLWRMVFICSTGCSRTVRRKVMGRKNRIDIRQTTKLPAVLCCTNRTCRHHILHDLSSKQTVELLLVEISGQDMLHEHGQCFRENHTWRLMDYSRLVDGETIKCPCTKSNRAR